MNDYLAALLFFLPAGFGNMTPVAASRLPYIKDWDTPLDFGKSWRGKRIFGDNKTWRGLVLGTLIGGLCALVVARLNTNTVVTIDPFWVGCLLGFGALAGDAIASFFKRQLNIAPGQSWFPVDQTDYIIGGLLLVYPFVQLPFWVIATIIITYFGLHLLVVYVFYLLGVREKPI